MSIELVSIYRPYVDELFATEAKNSLFTNRNFDFAGAHTVRIWKIGTSEMQDYGRSSAAEGNWSRYGAVSDLNAVTEEFTLQKDRSFTYVIDKLDEDESGIDAAVSLARQLREKVVPECDSFTIAQMVEKAGTKPDAIELTATNIYKEIIKASLALDNAEVPEEDRCLVITPEVYYLMKQSSEIVLETETGENMRIRGVIGNLDGAKVIRVPANRCPEKFGFMMCHPESTTFVEKLADYRIHANAPGISGSLVEGRIAYGAFVPDNRKCAIYAQMTV